MFDGNLPWGEREEVGRDTATPPSGAWRLLVLLLALTVVWLAALVFYPDAVSQLGANL